MSSTVTEPDDVAPDAADGCDVLHPATERRQKTDAVKTVYYQIGGQVYPGYWYWDLNPSYDS